VIGAATLGDVVAVGAVIVDFDGTACLDDVAEVVLDGFGDPSWSDWDERWARGEVSTTDVLRAQIGMLRVDRETMIGHVLEHCRMDPTFRPFVSWAESHDVPVQLASDGFGFYIPPLLEREGLGHLEVLSNRTEFGRDGGAPRIEHPDGHPECVTCGTCKMLAVQRAQRAWGPVAFVGEGLSDRYGALYADVVFAKDALPEVCRRDGVPFVPYEDFDDVREALEGMDTPPGPVAPARCPGWWVPQ